MNRLLELLERCPVVVLDGGMGTELQARGHDVSDALWSARLLRDDPSAIAAVHAAYVEAGAQVAITATYQATLERIPAPLFARATELARAAGAPVVAASVGPYGAARADGSEYTGAYELDEGGLHSWHAERFGVLAACGADLLACETIPSIAEARALLRLLDETPAAQAWFSFCCKDEHHLGDGTPLGDAVQLVADHARVLAVGVNCTAPERISALLELARPLTDKPLLAYPNSGEGWDAEGRCWHGAGASFEPALVQDWIARGARLLGGCCRTRPADIRVLARAASPARDDDGTSGPA